MTATTAAVEVGGADDVRPDGRGPAEPDPSRSRLARLAPLLVAALAGAIMAAVSAYVIWPAGTTNFDELAYLTQAEALAHGRVSYDPAGYIPDFQPNLAGVAGDRVVFKYQPLWPGVLAGAVAATGDHRPALVLAGAAAALAFWLLARELTGRPWLGTVAAVGVVVSPVFVSHSGTALAYLPAGALAAAALGAALRAERTGAWGWYVATGVGLGALFFHRPYDAVIAGVPVAVWWVWRAWRRRPVGPLLVTGLAAVPFLALWLAYNRLVTGSALQPAFSVDAPDDRFGFGRRASWSPIDPTFPTKRLNFTPGGSAATVAHFAGVSPLWVAGGLAALVLAGLAVVWGWSDPRRRLLASVVGATILAHAFWWGTQNFVNFGLDELLGPAYWLAGLGPIAALATAGGMDLAARLRAEPEGDRRWRRLVWLLAAAAIVSTMVTLVIVTPDIATARRLRLDQVDALREVPANSVVMVPGAPDETFVHTVVPADLAAADRLVANDSGGPEERFRLRDRFEDRDLYEWAPIRREGVLFLPPDLFDLVEVRALVAPQATLRLASERRGATVTKAWMRTLDNRGKELARVELPAGAGATRTSGTVGTPDGAAPLAVGEDPSWVAIGATLERPRKPPETIEVWWPARTHDGQVELLGPPMGRRFYELPAGPVWSTEDVTAAVTSSVDGLAPFEPIASERHLP